MKNEIKSESAPAPTTVRQHPLIESGLMSPMWPEENTPPVKREPGFVAPDFPDESGSIPFRNPTNFIQRFRNKCVDPSSPLSELESDPAQAGGFTPGPWNYRDGVETTYQVYAVHSVHPGTLSRSEEPIAEIPRPDNDDRGYAEADANAALIASAPSLLAERDGLKDLLLHTQRAEIEVAEERDRLRTALEKCLTPLIRLGDFVGNEDKGGASGLGAFNRCEIILGVRAALEGGK